MEGQNAHGEGYVNVTVKPGMRPSQGSLCRTPKKEIWPQALRFLFFFFGGGRHILCIGQFLVQCSNCIKVYWAGHGNDPSNDFLPETPSGQGREMTQCCN